jgi:hypothetical protein
MNENVLNANVGHRLRALQPSKNIRQADAAKEPGVNPAYLNLIEKGKRVTPFRPFGKALRYFEVNPESFLSRLGEGRVDQALAELLDEPLFISLNLGQDALHSLSAESKLAGTVAAPFTLYKNTRTQLANVMAQLSREERAHTAAEPETRLDSSPFDEVSDFLQAQSNFFPELEEETQALRKDFGVERIVLSSQLVRTGIGCRFCERTDRHQRAAASYRFAFSCDEYTKKDCFFSPLVSGDHPGKRRKKK